MTSVEDLVSDPSQHVRAALGTQISGLAPILGKDELVYCPRFKPYHVSDYVVQDYRPSSPDVPSNA